MSKESEREGPAPHRCLAGWLAWRRLALELACWRRAGQRPRLWWRDDDAVKPTPQLERLLALSAGRDLPITLAVIPLRAKPSLWPLLSTKAVTIAQHGTDHVNRSRGGGRSELAGDEAPEELAERLRLARAALPDLPNGLPLFVPPWNAWTPALAEALRRAGFDGLSAHGAAWTAAERPARLDVHVDLLRWKPGAAFRGTAPALKQLRRALRQRRRDRLWNAPVGLLTHHLQHDEATWRFLEELPRRLGRDVAWIDREALLGFMRP